MASISAARVTSLRLAGLATELVDLAYRLERQGRRDAADVALGAANRVRAIGDELIAGPASMDETNRTSGASGTDGDGVGR